MVTQLGHVPHSFTFAGSFTTKHRSYKQPLMKRMTQDLLVKTLAGLGMTLMWFFIEEQGHIFVEKKRPF